MTKLNFKSIATYFLILTLVLGSVYIPGNPVYAKTDFTAYADALNTLGVLEGTDKGYELERAPTRLEGLILFIKLLGEQDDLTSIKTFTTAFDDVPGWGSGFAEYAHAMGYTSGIGPRTFGPYQEIKANSYVTYLLIALGYEIELDDFTWETAIDDAVELGVIDRSDADMLENEAFTRGHVAYLSYKTLEAKHKYEGTRLYEVLKKKGKFTGELPEVMGMDESNEGTGTDTSDSSGSIYDDSASKNREKQIIDAYDAVAIPVSSASYYMEQPNWDVPYKAGKLNNDMVMSALDMINLVRMVAYLSDDVTSDTQWNDYAQHASLVNYVNDQMAHYPVKPQGMSDEMYELASVGARTSNLYYGLYRAGSMELRSTILGYMDDSDDFNIKLLGHRRWLLHPNMVKVGVGYITDGVKTHSAIKVFDENGRDFSDIKESADYVAWPSKDAFPLEYFGSKMAWSVHLNNYVFDKAKTNDIKVTLKNETTGEITTFIQDELKLMTEGTTKYFNIDTQGYGVPFAIIFRPDEHEYKDDEVYSVTITGLYKKSGEKAEIKFATRFFDL